MKPKGTVLIIGGAEDKGNENRPEIRRDNKNYEDFEILKDLLPTKGRARKIEIIATASSIPDEMDKMYKEAFRKIGFRDVGFIKIASKEEARDPKFPQRISQAHAVIFTGGDQFQLSAILGGTETINAIKDKYYHDKDFIVAGTSAGAMAMSKIMIYEGSVKEALLKDDVKISSGLGIFDTCIIDTHFIRRGRFGRLANAIIMNPEALGIGLGEDTTMVIRNGTDAECGGSGTVVVIDGNQIGLTNIAEADKDTPIFVENLKVHLLCKGCKFSIPERKMARPTRKKAALGKS